MPRVCLTEQQRKEAAAKAAEKKMHEDIYRMQKLLSDRISLKKKDEKMNKEEAAEYFGICRQSLNDLVECNDVRLNLKQLFLIFKLLGLEVS